MTNLLQILANPATESEANREGIEYVVFRIDFYSQLSLKLLKNSPGKTTDTWHGLEEQLLNLFKALLCYEMKSVCSYYRNQGYQIFRDFVKVDDFSESLKRIHEIDNALQADIRLTGDAELISFLDKMWAITKDHQKQIEMQVLQALFLIDPKYEIEELQSRKDQPRGAMRRGADGTLPYNPGARNRRDGRVGHRYGFIVAERRGRVPVHRKPKI